MDNFKNFSLELVMYFRRNMCIKGVYYIYQMRVWNQIVTLCPPFRLTFVNNDSLSLIKLVVLKYVVGITFQ